MLVMVHERFNFVASSARLMSCMIDEASGTEAGALLWLILERDERRIWHCLVCRSGNRLVSRELLTE